MYFGILDQPWGNCLLIIITEMCADDNRLVPGGEVLFTFNESENACLIRVCDPPVSMKKGNVGMNENTVQYLNIYSFNYINSSYVIWATAIATCYHLFLRTNLKSVQY